MSVGDIYQLVYNQDLASQLVVNVFHYLQTAPVAGGLPSEDLADGFEAAQAAAYETVLASAWNGLGTETVNIADPFDFDDRLYSPALVGVRVGQFIASSICWSFRYNRIAPGTRSGWKRLSGLSEDDVQGQTPDAGVVAALDAAAVVLAADVVSGGGTFVPVVVKRPIILGVNPTVFYTPTGVDFRGVGTQVSRKKPFS